MMNKLLVVSLSILGLTLGSHVYAKSKVANCFIQTTDGNYKGQCKFYVEEGGTFSLSSLQEGKPLLPNITDVNVYILEKGYAQVRGLTTDGINSMWGDATRSTKDKSCWIGSNFKICAK